MRASSRLFRVTVAWLALLAAVGSGHAAPIQTIHITARRYVYTPRIIHLKAGVPVVLEFTSADRLHGFKVDGLGLRADIWPHRTVRLHFVPRKAGRFPFHCDNFCGTGHDHMTGAIVVSP